MPPEHQSHTLDKAQWVELYQKMLTIRLAELEIVKIYPTDKIQSPVHLSIGQEAVAAGVCCALGQKDRIYGTYRGHGIYIGRGGGLKELFAELYAKDTGCARGKGGSMHLVAPKVGVMGCSAVVASTIPVAAGDALASQMKGTPYVVAAFFGDGAVDEGVFYESINFAALKKLPIVFVCENNGYAIHSRVADRHKQTELYRYGESLGMSGKRFDGNDVETVYTTMKQAVEEIRNGGEPRILEYTTFRHYEHVGIGQDMEERYRDPQELQKALQHDPIKWAQHILKAKFKITDAALKEWEAKIQKEIQKAIAFADASAFPSEDRLFTDLFLERS